MPSNPPKSGKGYFGIHRALKTVNAYHRPHCVVVGLGPSPTFPQGLAWRSFSDACGECRHVPLVRTGICGRPGKDQVGQNDGREKGEPATRTIMTLSAGHDSDQQSACRAGALKLHVMPAPHRRPCVRRIWVLSSAPRPVCNYLIRAAISSIFHACALLTESKGSSASQRPRTRHKYAIPTLRF